MHCHQIFIHEVVLVTYSGHMSVEESEEIDPAILAMRAARAARMAALRTPTTEAKPTQAPTRAGTYSNTTSTALKLSNNAAPSALQGREETHELFSEWMAFRDKYSIGAAIMAAAWTTCSQEHVRGKKSHSTDSVASAYHSLNVNGQISSLFKVAATDPDKFFGYLEETLKLEIPEKEHLPTLVAQAIEARGPAIRGPATGGR